MMPFNSEPSSPHLSLSALSLPTTNWLKSLTRTTFAPSTRIMASIDVETFLPTNCPKGDPVMNQSIHPLSLESPHLTTLTMQLTASTGISIIPSVKQVRSPFLYFFHSSILVMPFWIHSSFFFSYPLLVILSSRSLE